MYKNIILQKLSIDVDDLSADSNILKYGLIKFCKKINLKVISIVSGRDAKDNYYHWVIDVLPRLIILKKEIKKKKLLNLLVPNYKKDYQIESLNCFIDNKRTNFINLSKYKFMGPAIKTKSVRRPITKRTGVLTPSTTGKKLLKSRLFPPCQ